MNPGTQTQTIRDGRRDGRAHSAHAISQMKHTTVPSVPSVPKPLLTWANAGTVVGRSGLIRDGWNSSRTVGTVGTVIRVPLDIPGRCVCLGVAGSLGKVPR